MEEKTAVDDTDLTSAVSQVSGPPRGYGVNGEQAVTGPNTGLFTNRIVVVPWNGWDVLKAVAFIVGLLVVVLFVFIIALVFVIVALPEDAKDTFYTYVDAFLDYGVIYGVVLASIWFFSMRKYGASLRFLGFRRPSLSHLFLLMPLIFALDWGFEAAYTWLVSSVGTEALIPKQEYIQEMFDEAPFKPLLYSDIVVITPIVEEILFRGFILAGLTLALGNIRGLLISSMMFALVHIDLDVMPIIFVSGMLTAWLYMRTGSLWPPIAMHAANNMIATIEYEFLG